MTRPAEKSFVFFFLKIRSQKTKEKSQRPSSNHRSIPCRRGIIFSSIAFLSLKAPFFQHLELSEDQSDSVEASFGAQQHYGPRQHYRPALSTSLLSHSEGETADIVVLLKWLQRNVVNIGWSVAVVLVCLWVMFIFKQVNLLFGFGISF